MKKEELEKKLQEAETHNRQYQESRDRYNIILKKLFDKADLSILEKLDLCFDIYSFIRIERDKKDEKYRYKFETPIKGGWSSFHEESIETRL